MSRSGSDSNRRSVSDDIGSAKRIAEDDERSNMRERPKRLRRDGSDLQPDEEEDPDPNVVSRLPELGKTHSQPGTGTRRTSSSQPSSSLSSPLSSTHSRLAEDSGEMAQKAMEAWHNATGPKSEFNRQDLYPGCTSTADNTRIVVSPRSPGVSSGNGSNTPRDWLTATGERHYRTPLPTKKEPRSPEIGATRLADSPVCGSSSPQPPQHLTTRQNLGPGTDRGPKNSNSEGDQRSSNGSGDYVRTLAKGSIQLGVRDAPRWQTGVEARQLPSLSSLAVGVPAIGRNNMPRPVGPHSPGIGSFPSTFSVLSSDATQRHQLSNMGGRRREKKPEPLGARGHAEARPISQGHSSGDFQQESASRQDVRSDDGHPRSSPDFRNANSQQDIRRPVSAASTRYHIIQIRNSTPLHSTSQESFLPPLVTFTIDNRAESPLPTSDAQSYIENFAQHTAVVLPNTASDKDPSSYPISIIMWQGLNELYKWYAQLLHIREIGPLMFELIDVHWQDERSFVVPEGNLSYFRTMKQYVWDLYWTAVHVNKKPSSFRVRITRFSPRSPPKPDQRSSKIGGSPGRRRADQQNHIIMESRPGPLFPHQQPPIRPPVSTPVTIQRSFASHDGSTTTPHRPRSQRDSLTSIQTLKDENSNRQSLASTIPPIGHVRTVRDQAMLRERAIAYLAESQDLEALNYESTVLDKLPYKTGAEVCGVVVDKQSGKGMVAITGKGYITQNVKTGLDEPGDRYQEVTIQPKQTCMLHGEAVVLFYRRKQTPYPTSQLKPHSDNHGSTPSSASSAPEIIIRLQIDGSGRYSLPFDKSFLRPKITTTEFFSFFASQSGHCPPSGPQYLKFTFKDAMPGPKSTEIAKGNEDHFDYMRKDVKVQCEKAREYIEDLREFVILVSVPGWRDVRGDEEEW